MQQCEYAGGRFLLLLQVLPSEAAACFLPFLIVAFCLVEFLLLLLLQLLLPVPLVLARARSEHGLPKVGRPRSSR